MRRRILIALLAFGTVAGYASGFASLHRYRHGGSCHSTRWKERWQRPEAPALQPPATEAPPAPGPR